MSTSSSSPGVVIVVTPNVEKKVFGDSKTNDTLTPGASRSRPPTLAEMKASGMKGSEANKSVRMSRYVRSTIREGYFKNDFIHEE